MGLYPRFVHQPDNVTHRRSWHDLASQIRLVGRKVAVPGVGPITALTIWADAGDKPRADSTFLLPNAIRESLTPFGPKNESNQKGMARERCIRRC